MAITYDDWTIILNPSSSPKEVMLEITTKCNFSCLHCFRNKVFDEKFGNMSIGTYLSLLDQLEETKVKKIMFSGWGEPLAHPKILEFLKKAKEQGFTVSITTNGALLEKYAEDLYKLEVDEIVVSIDAPVADIYEHIRTGGSWEKIINGLLKIKELKKSGNTNPLISMHFTITKYNCGTLPLLPSFAEKFGIKKIVLSNVIPYSIPQESTISCLASQKNKEKLEKLFEDLKKQTQNSDITIILPRTTFTSERSCPFIAHKATFISWDGSVSPCIYYGHNWMAVFSGRERTIKKVTFGKIKDESLLEIWKNPEYIAFRFRATFFVQPSCLYCNFVRLCKFTESNQMDCWGNTPTCSSCPYAHDLVKCPL